jgi:hypothetical protein
MIPSGDRLNRLLAQSQSRISELERQMVEQESEFERVAERVQDKLKDQRSKVCQFFFEKKKLYMFLRTKEESD